MGRPVKAETIVLWLCVALVAIAGLAPIAAIAMESFWQNGHFSLTYYRELISAARFWPLLVVIFTPFFFMSFMKVRARSLPQIVKRAAT